MECPIFWGIPLYLLKMKNLLLVIYIFCSYPLFGQKDLKATYVFESYGSYETIGVLLVKGAACWYSRKEEKNTEVTEKGYEFYHYKNHLDWYYDLASKTIVQTRDSYRFPYLIAQWQAGMEWEITEETAEIAGYKVQKATTSPLYEDHDPFIYGEAIAWFTTEIPISAGPEGYYGLPGLIVKLEYSGIGIYKCTLQNVKFDTVESWQVPTLPGKIEVTKNEIYNLGTIDKKWLKQQKKALRGKGE